MLLVRGLHGRAGSLCFKARVSMIDQSVCTWKIAQVSCISKWLQTMDKLVIFCSVMHVNISNFSHFEYIKRQMTGLLENIDTTTNGFKIKRRVILKLKILGMCLLISLNSFDNLSQRFERHAHILIGLAILELHHSVVKTQLGCRRIHVFVSVNSQYHNVQTTVTIRHI